MDRGEKSEQKTGKRRGILTLKLVAAASAIALAACSTSNSPDAPKPTPSTSSSSTDGSLDLLSGHWQMAGSKLVNDDAGGKDLVVTATDLAIVEQDGSKGQANPPVNLYGTRLDHTGDFSITYTLTHRKGQADIRLMGQPPLIEDEFRAEMGTLTVSLDDKKLHTSISDQIDGNDNDGGSFDVTPDATQDTLTITDSADKLSITLNGKAVGEPISDHGLFKNGQVWFGMDTRSSDGTFTVSSLTAKGENGGQVSAFDTRAQKFPHLKDSLADMAVKKRPDFLLGAAVAPGPMVADGKYRELLGNFNSYTTENAGKWQFIHPKPDEYNFTEMDAIVDMAKKTGAHVHGHTLIFGEANPQWVQDLEGHPEALKQAAIDHITTIMKRYKGKIKSYDVINEPLADYDAPTGTYGLRKNIWYNTLGPDYLEIMLRAAQKADPDAELWINDFGMESDEDRFDQMFEIVKRLKEAGVPLTGIGFQSHFDEYDTEEGDEHIDTNMLRDRIKKLESIGLKSRFSEIDISNSSEQAVPAEVIKTCLGQKACVGATVWGITDRYSSGGEIDSRGIFSPGTGLLWDENFKPTKGATYVKAVLQ